MLSLPRKRLLYFLSLGIPTLFMGGAALFLLRQESQRLENRFVTDTRIKAEALAERLTNAIEDPQNELGNLLRFQVEAPFMEPLLRLKNSDPRVRQVFLWRGPGDVQVSEQSTLPHAEAQRFLQRYDSLFSDQNGLLSQAQESVLQQNTQQQKQSNALFSDRSVEALAYQWKVWFWEDQFSWLAWAGRMSDQGPVVIGVELESMYMLAAALATQQLPADETTLYRILDHRDTMFYQSGAFPEGQAQLMEVPIGKVLPGWRLQAAAPHRGSAGGLNFFAWPARILLVFLILAILLAGWALLRQADRDYRDALQKTNFVASVSHELKTPLTSISMHAEMLQAARVQDAAKRAHYLDVIVNQTERLTRLVNNVLHLGPLEQGKRRFQLRPVNLDGLVADVLATQAPRLNEEGFALKTRFDPVRVQIDPDALTQVILNLVDNALKYGVRDNGEKVLEVQVKAGPEQGELWVLDRGPGIPAKWREAIFEKFFRGDETVTRKQGGSGIGLAIARLLVAGMGGTLRYQTVPEGGACFVARFPKVGGEG